MTPLVLTLASGSFEAARQVDALPAGHRSRTLHGHSFQAAIWAHVPSGWADFSGGEVQALRDHLLKVIEPLDYAHLNTLMPQPTDEHIARWIQQRLEVPGLGRVAVQSTAYQGVDIDPQGRMHVWRRYRFQAAHRLPHVSLGHQCGRMHGHGFEVIVHAQSLRQEGDQCLTYDHLDALWAPLNAQLNHQCLNDLEGLENPTSEMLSSWLWARLQPALSALSCVTVFETASCGAHFDGVNYQIWKDFTLDSATQFKHAPAASPLARIHGYTYTLRLHLSAPLDTVMGWTIDFGDVKEVFKPIFAALDHRPLYKMADLPDGDTASLAQWIYRATALELPQLVRVDLFETPGCGAVVAPQAGGWVLPL
jgi:6-pyruvoyltetrahydropterin/6-carboxytetrahydropterin synthase